jgi:hypothetical protein
MAYGQSYLAIFILSAIGLLITAGLLADQPRYKNPNVGLNKAACVSFSGVVGAFIALFTLFYIGKDIEPEKRIVSRGPQFTFSLVVADTFPLDSTSMVPSLLCPHSSSAQSMG